MQRAVVEWRVNRRFGDHLCPRHQGNDAAASPRIFYWI